MSYTIRGIDHVVLRVVDAQRMARFYCDVLGTELVADRTELGLVHLRAGASLIDLVSVDGKLGRAGGAAPGPEGRNMEHVCLSVAPFDGAAIAAHLAAHGVQVEGEVKSRFGAEGMGTSLYLRDPEGNIVELKGPSDGALTPP